MHNDLAPTRSVAFSKRINHDMVDLSKSQKIGHSHLSPSPRTSIVIFRWSSSTLLSWDQYHPTLLLQVTREKIDKNCLGIWPPLATTCPDLYSFLRGSCWKRPSVDVVQGTVPATEPWSLGWEVALSWENLGDVFIICVPSMFEGGGVCLCDVNI